MGIKNSASLIKNNLGKLQVAMHRLTLKDVMVGIPKDETERKEGEINNATIGYIMDNGAPEMNIPARPTLIPGVEAVGDKVAKQLGMGARASVKGNLEAVETSLNRAGLIAQNSVKAKINSNVGPALAPNTLAARRRRGRTGTKTLVDTAQYRNSITYVIRSK